MKSIPFVALGLCALIGCGAEIVRNDECVPNEQQPCQCANGEQGFQTCASDGDRFSPCSCLGMSGPGGNGQGGQGGAPTGSGGTTNPSGGAGNPTGGSTPGTCDAEVPLLDHDIIDAEYSDVLDRLVTISVSPPALHVIDAGSNATQSVMLSKVPTAVSVAPDGIHAAVGHDARVSIVDLQALTVTAFHDVSTDVLDVVYAGNGFVHAFPRHDQWEKIHSVEASTGLETLSAGLQIYAGTVAKLHPGGMAMYGADNGLSPSDIERYDISMGPASYSYDSPYHGDHAMCGNLWLSATGDRIFTRCGNVFVTSPLQQQDMAYDGSLPIARIQHLSHAPMRGEIAAIPQIPGFDETGLEDTVVELFDDEFLQALGTVKLPCVTVGGNATTGHGTFVYPLGSGDGYAVVLEPEVGSGASGRAAIATVTP